jgi:hypothetical protein
MKGDLWVPVPGGTGHMHIGTYHLDVNEFHVSDEDGVPGSIIDVDAMFDGQEVVLKGFWKISRDQFETFRISWLKAKFPSIDWYGGRREVPGVPNYVLLDPDKGRNGG